MNKTKNILVLTQWSYKDPLIQAYTLPYVFIIADQLPKGSKIYLVTFEQERLKMNSAERKKVKTMLFEKGIILIDYSYSPFGILALIKYGFSFIHLLFIALFCRIKFIHAWCTTAGTLGYLLSLVSGKPLVIDSYEPHAEAMVENETWSRKGMKFKILFYFEKKMSRHAIQIISATAGMHDYAKIKYGIDLKNFEVKPACVDFESFNKFPKKEINLVNELKLENKIVCVYAGKFGGIYLTKETFDFFHEAEKLWGDRFRALILTPSKPEELNELASTSGFDPNKMIIRFVSHEDIPLYMGLGDFAITPVKPIPTKRYCTPIKDGEYWALGLPVVITNNISDDSSIIEKNNAGAVIQDLSSASYRFALIQIDTLLQEDRNVLNARIQKLALDFRSFKIAKRIYKKIYGSGN